MKKNLLLLLAMIVLLSGCMDVDTKNALAELEESIDSKDSIDSIDSDISLYCMDIKLPNVYKEVTNTEYNWANLYEFYLGDDLYMTVHYFPNEFEFSFYDYAYLSIGYFFEKSNYNRFRSGRIICRN